MKRKRRLEAAIGPAAREQSDPWADRHDRTWAWIVRTGVVIFGAGLLGLAGLAATEAFEAFEGVRSPSAQLAGFSSAGGGAAPLGMPRIDS